MNICHMHLEVCTFCVFKRLEGSQPTVGADLKILSMYMLLTVVMLQLPDPSIAVFTPSLADSQYLFA